MEKVGRHMNRRELMKLGLFSSAALALPVERVARTQVALSNRIATSELPQPFTIPFKTPPVLAPDRQTQNYDYYTLTQRQAQAEILPGKLTDIWGYNGITPGPTIMNTQGRHAVVQQINNLPELHPTLRYNVWTSTHLHGSCSKPQYDGYASDITDVDCWKDYEYPNIQDARTLWYHDHGVHITAPNAYMGLAAMYILHDPHELSLPIPHGAYDVPLVLRDAMFESDGQLLYDDNGHSGVYGDVILVNGVPWPKMQVERRKYRFRVLNASISRSYDLQLDSGEPLIVIGTDGGLMPHPQPVATLKSGMAERYEVVIDFSKYQIGQRVVLENVSPKNNIDHDTTGIVMAFDVVSEASDLSNNEVPFDLNPNMNVMGLTEADSMRTRHFDFERKGGNWTINGTTWDDVVNSDYQHVLANPGLNDCEIWELENRSGGWFHPIHIHLVDFKVLDRNGQAPFDYEKGPKDVVYVGENELVRVIMKFEHQQGRYMMHCHNLVHEDHDMMGQFLVGEDSPTCDPINADPQAKRPERPLRNRHDDPDEDEGGGGNGGNGGGSNSGSGSGNSGGGGGGDNSGHGNSDDLATASSVVGGSSVLKKATCAPAKKKPVLKQTAAQKKAAAKKKALAKKSTLKTRAAATSKAKKTTTAAAKKTTAAACVTPKKVAKPKPKAKAKAKRKPVTKRKTRSFL
jgi:FtsP/CotA-like multicopper oxidase with cupredoxin domain